MKITQILNEAFNEVATNELGDLLHSDYAQAWNHFLRSGKGIYRHDSGAKSKITLATPLKNRPAAYAISNLHNEYINKSQVWSNYPKRSVIGGSTPEIALRRGSSENIYLILPTNDTNIGVCPQSDIWASFERINTLMNKSEDTQVLDDFYRILYDFSNMMMETFDIKFHSWLVMNNYHAYRKELMKVDKFLNSMNSKSEEDIVKQYKIHNHSIYEYDHIARCILGYEYESGYMNKNTEKLCHMFRENGVANTMDKLFSPDGFTLGTIEEVIQDGNGFNEVWFYSTYIMLPYEQLDDLRETYKEK